jgi:NRAMP (natural resistance-associated macrophage protein)-like metal ion transporter
MAIDKAKATTDAPRFRGYLRILGPGLITGASDDDPSGIGSFSQIGAQFGFSMGWVLVFSFPLMAAIQEISARIGRVSGRGIAGNIRRFYSPALLYPVVALLVLANVINIGADLGAMGDALALLIGGPRLLYVAAFGGLCVALEIFIQYRHYVSFLKWTTLALLAYVGTAFVVKMPWGEVFWATFIPSLQFNTPYIVAIVAALGTTISPYLLFWQSSQEAEDERVDPAARPLRSAPEQAPTELRRIRLDTYIGMFISNLISWFILITVAATLHTHGVTNVDTSAQAAQALRPIAGPLAYALFALGIIGTGMLAVPVLAGSASYAASEAFRWATGLGRQPNRAKAFYGTIAVATALGVAFNLAPIDPIKALFWSAVLNGVVAVPMMGVTMVMARSPRVMGRFVLTLPLTLMGWLATLVMGLVVVGLFATWGS